MNFAVAIRETGIRILARAQKRIISHRFVDSDSIRHARVVVELNIQANLRVLSFAGNMIAMSLLDDAHWPDRIFELAIAVHRFRQLRLGIDCKYSATCAYRDR